MASPMPPGAPRPGYGQQPSTKYNPNVLADNMQNLNLNQPPAMPNSGSRPSPGLPMASPPRSTLPGPTFWSTGVPSPPSTLPPNVAAGRPSGPPVSQPPPPFASRPPPPGPVPSSTRGPVVPTSGGFPSSGSRNGHTVPPPPGVHPIHFASSSSLSSGPVVNTLSVPPNGAVTNGMPFASGAMPGGPRFPSVTSVPQPSMGSPPVVSAAAAPQSPPVSSVQSRPPFSLGAPGVPPPFLAGTQGVPPSPGPPFGAQTWPEQPQQPPRMFGMPPPLASHPMRAISPAMGQAGVPLAGHPKMDSKSPPRPTPTYTSIQHETRLKNQANPPPPVSSEFIARDTGNCNPRYMRCTINQIPCTADLLNTSAMQLALSVQPLVLPHPAEEPIQVADFGESGPLRCSCCKGFADETPRDYQCNLGPDGRRRDADERPELCRGTVEFVASKEYMKDDDDDDDDDSPFMLAIGTLWIELLTLIRSISVDKHSFDLFWWKKYALWSQVREPMPTVYFFLIDVSMNAIKTGATAAACNAINQVISDLPEGPRTTVGIATFDSTIHFYNLKRALQQPLMLIVPDVEDVYTPLQTDVVVQLSEENLELLLEDIPLMFQDNRTAESAFGAAIKYTGYGRFTCAKSGQWPSLWFKLDPVGGWGPAAFLSIKSTGGKLLVFQSGKLLTELLSSMALFLFFGRKLNGKRDVNRLSDVVNAAAEFPE
ncbi:unnamed protein product [Dovyalis caffra]|uniref:Sec23/Sec24 trunk domain-containing protein n=1 Tax=Dovyalis caffra TaxID=77055 RepID=A0AAV1SAQ6_9ROSI|nr:unnamed protein product [Dovyalis caffra]